MIQKKKFDDWKILGVLASSVRTEILKLLLNFEFRSLTEISRELKHLDWDMSLSGLLKHMKLLEEAGLVRHESGIFAEKPDARKVLYCLEGRERIEELLDKVEKKVIGPLYAGVIFGNTAKMAHRVQGMRRDSFSREYERLKSLLSKCDSEEVYKFLTQDEKKKLKLWRMMISIM